MEQIRSGWAGATALAAMLVLASSIAPAAPAGAAGDFWAPGSNWLSLRAGYAHVSDQVAPPGNVGYGFGYMRMLPRWWKFSHFSIGGYVHHELEGKYGSATLVDVPMTVELVRHSMWATAFRPYIGAGYGAYHIKFYRAPGSPTAARNGGYVVFGGNVPISGRTTLGLDTRYGAVKDTGSEKRLSVKLNYSIIY
ncbi:MAG: hypothetical protein A2W00_02255 [Candidatus Eisenbacteria bacterium RBG_16_71_46]|nr:MAG: hypothetical protein A2W00_02255 [Candidatus Eisenbacteria bacterium RBG_16_71_46]